MRERIAEEIDTSLPAAGMALLIFAHGWWRLSGLALWLALDAQSLAAARRTGDRRRLVRPFVLTLVTAGLAVYVFVSASTVVWALLAVGLLAIFFLSRDEWLQVVSWTEIGRFVAWSVVLAAAVAFATVVVLHQAERRAVGSTSFPYVTGRGLVAVLLVWAVALVGGLTVFRARTRWIVLLVAVTLGTTIPWSVLGTTADAMGAMKPTGVGGRCLGHAHACGQFAYVAGLAVAISPFVLAPLFAAAFAAKRRVTRGGGTAGTA